MKKAILGKKLGMTQIFMPDGSLVPVTVIEAGPCTVVQKKTVDTDGYEDYTRSEAASGATPVIHQYITAHREYTSVHAPGVPLFR